MSKERHIDVRALSERTRQAIHALQFAITARNPTTTFELALGPDVPASLHLLAVADVDDPDEVGDLVVERVVELQIEEGIPLHVIPCAHLNVSRRHVLPDIVADGSVRWGFCWFSVPCARQVLVRTVAASYCTGRRARAPRPRPR